MSAACGVSMGWRSQQSDSLRLRCAAWRAVRCVAISVTGTTLSATTRGVRVCGSTCSESDVVLTRLGVGGCMVGQMFQVLTGDSWSSNIARGMFGPDGNPTPEVALFFVSAPRPRHTHPSRTPHLPTPCALPSDSLTLRPERVEAEGERGVGRSYLVAAGIFVLNVVVAVMLDEFISAVQRDKLQHTREAQVPTTRPQRER